MMKLIDIDKIIVPENRQRQEFNERKIEELRESIFGPSGLLQPLVLRNDARTLVAGERRLRAIRSAPEGASFTHDGEDVPLGSIPYVVVRDLTPDQLREAEFHENLHRVDLTWQEQTKIIAELHAFRMEQGPQTIQQTAEEVSGEKTDKRWSAEAQQVSDAIDLAKLLDNPLIAAAPDAKTAKKILTDLQKQEQRKLMSAEWGKREFQHTLIHGDCYEVLADPKYRGVFDIILTDPPYGIDAHKKTTFSTDRHDYDDSYEGAFKRLLAEFPALSFAVAAEQAHLFLFCDVRRYPELWPEFVLAGWDVWPKPLIWDKRNVGSYGNIQFGFRETYDCILYANKGKRPMAAYSADVISIGQRTNLPHPAGKPVELFSEILRCSSLPGNKVLDAFCGHGPIFEAATERQCVATAIEGAEKYYHMAQESLAGVKTNGNQAEVPTVSATGTE